MSEKAYKEFRYDTTRIHLANAINSGAHQGTSGLWRHATKFVIRCRASDIQKQPTHFVHPTCPLLQILNRLSARQNIFHFQLHGRMMKPNRILIDVRTPAEYATGFLSADTFDAINIEYQLIEQLPEVLSEHGIDIQKTDLITLYCRSGRRSNLALQALKSLGYSNVRDIGGFEEARAVLKREEALRVLDEEATVAVQIKNLEQNNEKKEAREKSFGNLLAGLKELE